MKKQFKNGQCIIDVDISEKKSGDIKIRMKTQGDCGELMKEVSNQYAK